MKQLFPLLLGTLVFASGCGASGNETSPENNENNASAKETVEENGLQMDSAVKVEDGNARFSIALTNVGEEVAQVSFSSGQQYEIVVTNEEGKEVYRYSEGQMFTQAIVEKEIEPGESLHWEEEWNTSDENVKKGEYQAEISLLVSTYNDESVDKQAFTTNQTFTIGSATSDSSSSVSPENGDQLFRNIEVTRESGQYVIKGEADTEEGVFYFKVENDKAVLIEETDKELEEEGWSEFEIELEIPEEKIPDETRALTLHLYEKDTESNEAKNHNYIPLEVKEEKR